MSTVMATPLPPRNSRRISSSNDAGAVLRAQSSLDTLLQMGFSKQRSAKAIAATGDRGVQLASDWLLSHVNDPMIDDDIPREYTVYLCPTGHLQSQLEVFWHNSKERCGWNGALKSLPHITLCSFFMAPDAQVSILSRALKKVVDLQRNLFNKLDLEHFSSPNFIGLFVSDKHAVMLQKILEDFANELSKSGIRVEPHKKQLHVTLAYQFLPEHRSILTELSKDIDISDTGRWEIRLYSRDQRQANKEVLKVIYSHEAEMIDELDLIPGDYVFADKATMDHSEDGWFVGTSWLTGMTGVLPGVFTERVAESEAWTLHRSMTLITGTASLCEAVNGESTEPMYAKVKKPLKGPKKILVVRHGERVDWGLGKDWILNCFDQQGNFHPGPNVNMPRIVPMRKGPPSEYIGDSPITEMGAQQAKLLGKGLKLSGIQVSHVYCSPALRCVQTAHKLLKGLGCEVPICIEPGFFEWLGWHQDRLPKFFTPDELKSHGYNVNTAYKSFQSVSQYNFDETSHQCYHRMHNIVKHLLKVHQKSSGSILIIGHAANLDCCTRQLVGREPRPSDLFSSIVRQIPYCGLAMCETESSDKWKLVEPPVQAPTHCNNRKFDYTCLTKEDGFRR